MHPFAITTDSGADLPQSYCEAREILVLPLPVTMNGEVYETMDVKEFYRQLRAGAMPTTSAANLEDTCRLFRQVLSTGSDLLHIAFSSGLSSSCDTAFLAAKEMETEFPDRKILVVDSLSASLGQGFLVNYGVKCRERGLTLEETRRVLEAIKGKVVHDFTVDDLHHLHRGGRVSKTTAVMGSLMNIKPMLHVDKEGHLVALGKVRGRKAAIGALVESMARQGEGFDQEEVFISHGDCLEDALTLQSMVEERFGIHNFLVAPIGPTIGTHSGPGTLALFFLGRPR